MTEDTVSRATLNRDKARPILEGLFSAMPATYSIEGALNALEECVTPDPAQTIDRDDLREIVADYGADEDAPLGATLDAIVALLRPDARIAAIEALLDQPTGRALVHVNDVRAILRGEQ